MLQRTESRRRVMEKIFMDIFTSGLAHWSGWNHTSWFVFGYLLVRVGTSAGRAIFLKVCVFMHAWCEISHIRLLSGRFEYFTPPTSQKELSEKWPCTKRQAQTLKYGVEPDDCTLSWMMNPNWNHAFYFSSDLLEFCGFSSIMIFKALKISHFICLNNNSKQSQCNIEALHV